MDSSHELIVCGADEVAIYRLSDAEPEKRWSWRATDDPGLPPDLRSRFVHTDDCKPVGGDRILITASSGEVTLVERRSRRSVFSAPVPNAHSAALLPGDRVAVASSTAADGNHIVLFDIAKPGAPLSRVPLHSAHGAVWDEPRRLLWALGFDALVAYRVADERSPQPVLQEAFRHALPDENGHDLIEWGAELLLTTGRRVWRFDRETRRFTPDPLLGDKPHVKSVALHPQSGRIAYIQAESPNWWAERIHLLNPSGTLCWPGQRLYKARWNLRL